MQNTHEFSTDYLLIIIVIIILSLLIVSFLFVANLLMNFLQFYKGIMQRNEGITWSNLPKLEGLKLINLQEQMIAFEIGINEGNIPRHVYSSIWFIHE